MSKPTILYPWGAATPVAPTGGHQASGFATNEVPGAHEVSTLLKNITDWSAWRNSARVRHIPASDAIVYVAGVAFLGSAFTYIWTSNAGVLIAPIVLTEGERLVSAVAHVSCSTTDVLRLQVIQNAYAVGTAVTAGQVSIGGPLVSTGHAAVVENLSLNFTASASGLNVTVDKVTATYTRSAGNFIADGFQVGQVVTWSGFANGGNNISATIITLTTTVMTFAFDGGRVNEVATPTAVSVNQVIADGSPTQYIAYIDCSAFSIAPLYAGLTIVTDIP